ncbi:T9SS type A sorting domain-containing protein [Chryseobacterium sp. JM1]|uniref:T9SS type A sorting domain-containing protein n=1 Tax=Chryseobacterium sp. JM1 TaxID=1233950 RepID=UPI0009DD2284|nr:T9SS type A sorting domain-containing protein [Chryseobacterium sp. JM1]
MKFLRFDSADGRLVLEGKLEGQKTNLAALVKGVYIISITSETETYSTRLIKK